MAHQQMPLAITPLHSTGDDCKHLVIDSGALIANAKLDRFGPDVHYWTIREVVDEVRDENARRFLDTFPYKIQTTDVSDESLAAVTAFARKTGDIASLSRTDLRILALAYSLEKQEHGTEHIRTQPVGAVAEQKAPVAQVIKPASHTRAPLSNPAPAPVVAGPKWAALKRVNPFSVDELLFSASEPYYGRLAPVEPDTPTPAPSLPDAAPATATSASMSAHTPTVTAAPSTAAVTASVKSAVSPDVPTSAPPPAQVPPHSTAKDVRSSTSRASTRTEDDRTSRATAVSSAAVSQTHSGKVLPGFTSRHSKGDADDEGEWITPLNVEEQRFSLSHVHSTVPLSSVACVTTDYAMQNVMLQMGLRLISVNGLAISSVRIFALKCHACFAVTREMDRVFCPSCGSTTLIKMAIQTNADGSISYRGGYKKHYNNRGTKYSIPKPVGGRQNADLVLREDMYLAKVPRQKQKQSGDLFEDAIEFGYGGGGARKGPQIGYGKKNPNASYKGQARRKK